MKSAYELAMERLAEAGGPTKTLTDEQKARIADIEKKYGGVLNEIGKLYEELPTFSEQYTLLRYMSLSICRLSSYRLFYPTL